MSKQSHTLPAFDGFASPNFTQVPDELFDVLMPSLSDAELRVLMYIIRRTFGFKRDSDSISLSQMVSGITTRDGRVLDSGTGLSKATVARGLKGLREQGIVVAERHSSAERGHEATSYRLRFKSEAPSSIPPVSQQQDKGHSAPLVSIARQALSQPRDTQQTGSKRTDFESSNPSTDQFLADDESDRQKTRQLRDEDIQQASVTTASSSDAPLKDLIARRAPKRVAMDEDRQAIGSIIERFAAELNDQAPSRSSVTRAMNLFEQSGAHRDGFVDLLFQARASTKEMRNSASKRPLKPMAYFFSVVEERLGFSQRRTG